MVKPAGVSRGDVFLVDVGAPRGAEIRKVRPCVVVSPDEINAILPTCVIAPMTTGGHPYPFRVPCRFHGKSVQFNAPIETRGVLEYGSWVDPETGFVSQLRLRDAAFDTV